MESKEKPAGGEPGGGKGGWTMHPMMMPVMLIGAIGSAIFAGIEHPDWISRPDDRPQIRSASYGDRIGDRIERIERERSGLDWRWTEPQRSEAPARLYEEIEGRPRGYYEPPRYYPRPNYPYQPRSCAPSCGGAYRIVRDECGARIVWTTTRKQTLWQRRTAPGAWSWEDEEQLRRMFRYFTGRY